MFLFLYALTALLAASMKTKAATCEMEMPGSLICEKGIYQSTRPSHAELASGATVHCFPAGTAVNAPNTTRG